jgi:hypothetical protein
MWVLLVKHYCSIWCADGLSFLRMDLVRVKCEENLQVPKVSQDLIMVIAGSVR